MKRKLLLLLCLLLLLSLAACGDSERPCIDVYRPRRQQDSGMLFGLVSEEVELEPGISPLSFIIGVINAEPKRSDAEKPLPEGIYISGFNKQGKTLTLKLTGGFSELHGSHRALAEASLIMTFTDFSDIELVSIEEGNRVIVGPKGRNSLLFEDLSLITEK